MVRLKVIVFDLSDLFFYRFQFLMVRLKDCLFILFLNSQSIFQFLMVRLKVLPFYISVTRFQISIPYGAIKSPLTFSSLSKKRISIPYGAIKRNVEKQIYNRQKLFQFLMVRLKERLKRFERCKTCTFQFLMVRLKAQKLV